MALDLNDPKNLEKFMASGSKTSYADWAKQQDLEQTNVVAQNKANAGNIAETNANFNYAPIKQEQVSAAVVPQAPVSQTLPKLTATQTSQLDNLGNIRTSLTGTDITNLKTAVNQGYNIPENIKNLLIKQGLAQDFNIGLPNTGKTDLTMPEINGEIDAASVKSGTTKPEDLLGTTTPKTTIMDTPQAIDSMLSTGQQSLDALYKQQESANARLKDLEQAENDRLAKGLEDTALTSIEAKTKEYYDKYDVDSAYNAKSNVLKQIANARAMYAGTTGTGALTREGIAKISQLQAEYALFDGDFTQAKDMANTYIDAAKTDLTNKINTYETLLNRSDSKLITLTKDQKDIVNNRIALYEDAIKREDEKKAALDKVLTDNSGYTMQRARTVYGLDTTKDDAQTIQDKVAKAKADQSFVDALASKYYDAGITANDTLQSATNKMKSSQSYKQEILSDSKSDSAVLSRAMTLLNSGQAKDIYEALDMANTQIANEESTRTIEEKTKEITELTLVDKIKDLPASIQTQILDTENSINLLEGAEKTLEENSNVFGPLRGKITENNPYAGAVEKSVESQMNILAQTIGKALEGGKLTDQDIIRYRTMLPSITDTPEQAKAKLDNVKALIDNNKNTLYSQYGLEENKINPSFTVTSNDDLKTFVSNNPEYKDRIANAIDVLQKKYGDKYDFQDILKLALQDNYNDFNFSFKVEGSDSQNATKALSFDTNGLQCGEFVNKTANMRVGNTWTEKANNVSKYGYKGSDGLGVGDVVYQNTGTPYGHVAVVTGINDDGTYTVSESNWNNDEKVTHGRKVSADKIYGYIRPSEAGKLAISSKTTA